MDHAPLNIGHEAREVIVDSADSPPPASTFRLQFGVLSLFLLAIVVFLTVLAGGWRWWQTVAAIALLPALAASFHIERPMLVALMHLMSEPAFAAPPQGVAVERDVVYAETTGGPLLLDIYMPETKPTEKLPVIMFFFGGCWFAGNKNQVQMMNAPDSNVFQLLAERGYALISVNYRFSSVAPFPAQLHDVKASVRWVRANADRYGFNADAIGVWGLSAGAHLAALLATTGGIAELEGAVGGTALLAHSSSVHACADFYGPTHLPRLAAGNSEVSWMLERLLGGPIVTKRKLADQGSPELHISSKTAPHFIVQGEDDSIVNPDQSTTYHAKLQAAGVDSTLHVIPGAQHGLPASAFMNADMHQRVVGFFDRNLARALDPHVGA